MSSLYLGVDIGTSSSKGVLVRDDGTVAAQATRAHGLSLPHPGWAEHYPDAVWWADFCAIASELTRGANQPITAVGVSGIGPCLLPTDASGTPLRPAILYGIDTRAEREIAELTEELGAEAVVERCGSPLTSQAIGPKLAWLRRHEPEVWQQTRRIYMASSYLVHQLTGSYVLDHHSASQSVPLYDTRTQKWIPEWSKGYADHVELPELRWPAEVAGTVTAAAAAQTGLATGTPVAVGTIDAWAEALSVGVRAPGDVMLMYGTTMFIVANQAVRRTAPTLWGRSAHSRAVTASPPGWPPPARSPTGSARSPANRTTRRSPPRRPDHRPAPTGWSCCPTSPVSGRRCSTRAPVVCSPA